MLTFAKDDKIESMDELDDLPKWLQEQLDIRHWSATDLAKKAKIGTSTVTRILNGDRNAGSDVCTKLAQALDEDPKKVFRLAGLLPKEGKDLNGLSEYEKEVLGLVRQLDEVRQWAALEMLKGLVGRAKKR